MSSEETKVAVMQKQVEYITKQVDNIVVKLDDNTKVQQDQINRLQLEVDKRFEGAHTRIDTKADKIELEKINTILSRINWIIITAVLGALLALVFTTQK